MEILFSHYIHEHDDDGSKAINRHHIDPVESLTEAFEYMAIQNVFLNLEDSEEEIYF